jgi:preprotein translocase subunit SecG
MFTLFITLIIIAALLLILVVLAQNPKGGGLSSQFGGSASSQIMGVKRTSDLLEKLTWGLAIFILAFSLGINFFIGEEQGSGMPVSPNIERAQDRAIMPGTSTIPFDADEQGEGTSEEGEFFIEEEN